MWFYHQCKCSSQTWWGEEVWGELSFALMTFTDTVHVRMCACVCERECVVGKWLVSLSTLHPRIHGCVYARFCVFVYVCANLSFPHFHPESSLCLCLLVRQNKWAFIAFTKTLTSHFCYRFLKAVFLFNRMFSFFCTSHQLKPAETLSRAVALKNASVFCQPHYYDVQSKFVFHCNLMTFKYAGM